MEHDGKSKGPVPAVRSGWATTSFYGRIPGATRGRPVSQMFLGDPAGGNSHGAEVVPQGIGGLSRSLQHPY
jgi:hypothetical protein